MIIDKETIYFQKFFQPLSNTCLDSNGENTTFFNVTNNEHVNYQVVELKTIAHFNDIGFPDYYPPKVPAQISEKLQQLSGEPYIMFVGNVLRYLLQTNNEFNEYFQKFKNHIDLKHPVVGIHVRRTDKLEWEANNHTLDEYMTYVEDFYNKIDFTNDRKGSKNKTKRVIYCNI